MLITANEQDIAARIRATDDPVEAMYLGKSIQLDEVNKSAWTERKEQIMDIALEAKFHIPQFTLALRQAGDTIGEATKDKNFGG